ncbi:MAG: hypothetical protein ABEL76_03865 [Bradymonadaceae bacterium]
MVLGTDYVVGRYLLPLVIGIAAVFALVLSVVLRPSERDETPGSDSSPNPEHLS